MTDRTRLTLAIGELKYELIALVILVSAIASIATVFLTKLTPRIYAAGNGATHTAAVAMTKTELSTDQITFMRVALSQCPTRLLRMVNENQTCGCTKLSVQEHMVCLNRDLTSATTLTEILSTTGGPIFDGLRDQ